MSAPRVSIGLAVYNGAPFLPEALDTWLAQDFEDFELVVSDNASTDDTPRILAAYAERDSRIRVVTRKRTIVVWDNYNALVDEAAAPVFCWSACDDRRHPSYLSKLLAALDAQPDAVLTYGLSRLFGDERRVARHVDTIDETPGDEPTALGRMIALLRSRQWYLIYGLIRTDVLRRTSLFHHPMGFPSDVGLCLELATHGRLHCIRERLLEFRLHSTPRSFEVDPDVDPNRGRRLDDAGRAFAQTLELPEAEQRLFLRQLEVWCRKSERPRHHVWRSSAFRSLYVRGSHAWIDAQRALRGL